MLICFLCTYYTKHLAFRPLQTPQLTGVVIHRPDETAPRRAVLKQDRKDLFWNVPFQYVALKNVICCINSHLSFAFYTKNQPSNNLTIAVFGLEMSSFTSFGGLARCGLLFRLQIGFGPCVRHDTPDTLDDRRERLIWLGN